MKRLLLLLALLGSVGANVWLLRDFLRGQPGVAEAPAVVGASPAPARDAGAAVDTTAQVDRRTWEQLTQGGDPAALVARLRALGFPPKAVRAILTLHLEGSYAERTQAIHAALLNQPYWRSIRGDSGSPPEFNLARRALRREIDERVTQLLGSQTAEMTPEEIADWRSRHGELSPEKIVALERIAADYRDLRNQVTTLAGRILLPEDREKLALLDREMRADTARALTPTEREEHELRTGRTAQALRATVVAFRPTEQEFRALHRVMQTLEAQFDLSGPPSPEARRQREEAEAQLAPQIAAVLGPERYADYQRTTDPAWRTAHYYVGLNGLPRTIIGELVGVERDLAPRAQAVRDNPALTAEQRSAQLAAIVQEAEQRLTATLDAERAATYKDGNTWLRALQSPPRR